MPSETSKEKVYVYPNLDTPVVIPSEQKPSRDTPRLPDLMKNIPEGSFLNASSGAYSSYCIQGTYRVLKEIDPNLMLKGWLEKYPEEYKPYRFHSDKFLEWLESLEFIKKLETIEWHLDDYGNSHEMSIY